MQARQPRVGACRLSVPRAVPPAYATFYNRSCTRTYELARAPPFPSSACVPASSFSTYLLRELLHCHRSFQTRHCPVHRRCPRGAGRAPDPACSPVASLMLPSAGPRGAHTAHSDTPCGTTTDGPDPAPTRRSLVASAHPKPGYQRGQARACHFHAGYARPNYLLFRGSHCCQMTIPLGNMLIGPARKAKGLSSGGL